MSAVIIEHVNIADLPQSWRLKLTALSSGQVTVRIEPEQTSANDIKANADPAFGMWADRADLSDPTAYAQKLRAPRYNSDGQRSGVVTPVLVDTDVLVWYFRGNQSAVNRLNQISDLAISSITYLELLQGVRNRAEMLALQKSLNLRNAVQLPVTPQITQRAASLMEALTLSHGLQLGDALIAATALEHGMQLLTGNVKHFSAVDGLIVVKFEAIQAAMN